MKPTTVPDGANIPAMVSHLVGTPVSALALVCAVGDGSHASVAAFITPGAAGSAPFRHAIEMEGAYSNTLLSFDENQPPYYGGNTTPVNLNQAANELGVDRVLCLVTLNNAGSVAVVRNYDGLEVTLLEAANLQFSRFQEILDGTVSLGHRRMQ
jgi:hypothetical protein